MSPHRRRRVPLLLAAAVLLAACGGSDEAGGDAVASDDSGSDETVLPEPSTTDADPASAPESGSSELTQVTTTAEADEEAERTQVAPRKDVVTRSPDAVGDGNPPDTTTALVEIIDADGEVCIVCMWLADDADERGRGLMNVYDLGVPIGMAFTWDAPTSGLFFMFNTPTPLSIAWFAPDGTLLSEADMEPCLDETRTDCERYGTTGEYTMAIEMFQGELGKVGIGPGSTARILEAGDSEACPLLPA